jgi:hypothetical protein
VRKIVCVSSWRESFDIDTTVDTYSFLALTLHFLLTFLYMRICSNVTLKFFDLDIVKLIGVLAIMIDEGKGHAFEKF